MTDDVWKAGAQGGGEVDLGRADYGEGMPANRAFAIDTVLRNGVRLLMEQPALVLLAGFNVWLVQMIPGVLRLVLDVGAVAAEVGGGVGDDELLQFVPAAVQLITQAALFPVQQVVIAGALVAVALYLKDDEAPLGLLYTSFSAAVRALLYALLASVLTLGLTLVLVGLAAGAAAGVYMATSSVPLTAGVGILGVLLTAIPIVYVTLGLQLGAYAAVIDELWPLEALAASWRAADGARIMLFLTNFVTGLLGFIAYCMLWVPAIVVIGVSMAGLTAGWVLYSRSTADTSRMAFFRRAAPQTA